MSRIIKFRAWDKTYKRMNYKVQVGNTDYADKNYTCNSIWVDYGDSKSIGWMNADDNCIDLMQFTGLLDRHGKDIYECDIISVGFSEDKQVVYYDDNVASFVLLPTWTTLENENKLGGESNFDGFDNLLSNSINNEIIGNIYQNPELLNN